MAEIILHGALGKEFGRRFTLDVATPAEAVRALAANFPTFAQKIREGTWHVIRGKRKGGRYLGEDELALGLGRTTELHLVPAVQGSRGAGKAIIGAVLLVAAVVAAVYTGGTSLTLYGSYSVNLVSVGMMGASMMFAGISQMMAPTPKTQSFESADANKSYLFAGPTNRLEQGGPVPLIYGRCRVGSVCVSAGITVDDIAPSSENVTGAASQPRVNPESATRTYDASPADFAVTTILSDCAGYRVTDISGGTLVKVVGTNTLPVTNGDIVWGNAVTLRFTPTMETVYQRPSNESNSDGGTVSVFRGGTFVLQSVAASGVTIGMPRMVDIVGQPETYGDNGQGGDGAPF